MASGFDFQLNTLTNKGCALSPALCHQQDMGIIPSRQHAKHVAGHLNKCLGACMHDNAKENWALASLPPLSHSTSDPLGQSDRDLPTVV